MKEADTTTYYPVAPIEDLPPGERLFLDVNNEPIVIFRVGDMYYAIGDVCTHDHGPLGDGDLDQFEIICPRHGARFDIRSGKATQLPAVIDAPWYPVRIIDGKIEIGISK